MATATLVSSDIEIGRRIVEALTRRQVPVTVYLWAFIAQLQEWQFIIATPLVDTKGPLAAYGEVNKALQKEGLFEDVPSRRIFLKSPTDRVLRSLEKESRVVSKEAFRVINEPIAGTFVEDAYLYTGSLRVIGPDESTPDEYFAFYVPHSRRVLTLAGIEGVREFLGKIPLSREVLEYALKQLTDHNGVSIPNVQLRPHDLKRLNLA